MDMPNISIDTDALILHLEETLKNHDSNINNANFDIVIDECRIDFNYKNWSVKLMTSINTNKNGFIRAINNTTGEVVYDKFDFDNVIFDEIDSFTCRLK